MKQKFFGILCLLAVSFSMKGQSRSVDVVNEFSTHLSNWSGHSGSLQLGSTNYSPRIRLNGLLDLRRFCLDTKQIAALAIKYGVPTSKSYDAKIFDDLLVDAISNGTDAYISNIRYVPREERDVRYPDYETISCQLHVSGINPSTEDCAFVLSPVNHKILKITPYTIVIDKKGHKRMKIDLKEFVKDSKNVWGIGYNYSKNFPIGVGGHIIREGIMIGAAFGYAPKRPNIAPYTTHHNDIKDLCNYEISNGTFYPKTYLSFSIGYAINYVAFNWGFGGTILEGDNIIDCMSTTTYSDGSARSLQYQTSETEQRTKFIMRPNIQGFIPCGNGYDITLSLSYLWAPAYKQMNSFDFGIGINIPYND
ncbi:MAG: hypothetical protein HDS96_00310 [Bacteroidales bacterium]|nr:hypothetical protein [Bacteroidales bacterium]